MIATLWEIGRKHIYQIAVPGGLFGWLLSVPLFGPVLAAEFGASAPQISMYFLYAHALTLLTLAVIQSKIYFPRRMGLVGVALLLVLSPAAWLLHRHLPEALPLLGILFGTLAALILACWWQWFLETVGAGERGRVLALAMLLSNLVLWLTGIVAEWHGTIAHLAALVALLLPLAAFGLAGNEPRRETGPVASEHKMYQPQRIFLFLGVFLFVTFTIGGVMYNFIHPRLEIAGTIDSYLRVLSYIIVVPFAGIIADRWGRRSLSFFAITGLGLGYISFAVLTGIARTISTQVFLEGGFAFLDLFAWVVLADLSAILGMWAAFTGLGLMVAAIISGVWLTMGTASWLDESTLAVFLPLTFLFIAVTVLWGLRETLPPPTETPEGTAGQTPSATFPLDLAGEALTPRELEIVDLLRAGKTTGEMTTELHISTNTLKTHLRHIYRKKGVANRKELLRKMRS